MKHAALFLCLMASIAMADEKQDFLDGLQIPENLGPLGREGLANAHSPW